MLQISVPSRTDVKEYQDLKEEMDQLVGRINGRFTTPNWSPIRYIYGCVNQVELAAFYRDSAVALVTPLRDGKTSLAANSRRLYAIYLLIEPRCDLRNELSGQRIRSMSNKPVARCINRIAIRWSR